MKAEQFCVKKTVLVTLKSAWDVILANVKFLCFVCSSRDYCVFRQPVFFFLSSSFFFFFLTRRLRQFVYPDDTEDKICGLIFFTSPVAASFAQRERMSIFWK